MTPHTINILKATLTGEFTIKLWFDDATEQEINFKPFLSKSIHPAIRAYLEPARFAAFRIEYGELIWGDYDLCFPIIDLYKNQIDPSQSLEAAA